MPHTRTRCMACNSVVTKNESECYVCGEPVPGAKKSFLSWLNPAPKPGSGKRNAKKSSQQKVAERIAFFAATK